MNTIQKILGNKQKYELLLLDHNYINVHFDEANGALMATHIQHHFDPQKGAYEIAVQQIGYNNGNAVILEKETGGDSKKRYADGRWNGKYFEISSRETATPRNIKKGLNHCASKPNVKIAVLYFPNNNFDIHNFNRGLAMYNGTNNKKFDEIICMSKAAIINRVPPLFVCSG